MRTHNYTQNVQHWRTLCAMDESSSSPFEGVWGWAQVTQLTVWYRLSALVDKKKSPLTIRLIPWTTWVFSSKYRIFAPGCTMHSDCLLSLGFLIYDGINIYRIWGGKIYVSTSELNNTNATHIHLDKEHPSENIQNRTHMHTITFAALKNLPQNKYFIRC